MAKHSAPTTRKRNTSLQRHYPGQRQGNSASAQAQTDAQADRSTATEAISHRPVSPSPRPSTPKAGPGRRRSEASHQAILQAATALLQETGYVGMSIEAIARRAGVGKQTIYRWWRSKAEVVLELYRDLVSQSLEDPNTGSVHQDLVAWVGQLVTLLTSSASTQALTGILAEAQADTQLAQNFRQQIIADRRRVIYTILERGLQRGELRDDLNLELAADLIYSPIWYRLLLGSTPLAANFAEQLVDELMLGLQAFEEEI